MKALTSSFATIIVIVIGIVTGAGATANQPDHYNLSEKTSACENIGLSCLVSVLSPTSEKEYDTHADTNSDLGAVNHRFN